MFAYVRDAAVVVEYKYKMKMKLMRPGWVWGELSRQESGREAGRQAGNAAGALRTLTPVT